MDFLWFRPIVKQKLAKQSVRFFSLPQLPPQIELTPGWIRGYPSRARVADSDIGLQVIWAGGSDVNQLF